MLAPNPISSLTAGRKVAGRSGRCALGGNIPDGAYCRIHPRCSFTFVLIEPKPARYSRRNIWERAAATRLRTCARSTSPGSGPKRVALFPTTILNNAVSGVLTHPLIETCLATSGEAPLH